MTAQEFAQKLSKLIEDTHDCDGEPGFLFAPNIIEHLDGSEDVKFTAKCLGDDIIPGGDVFELTIRRNPVVRLKP